LFENLSWVDLGTTPGETGILAMGGTAASRGGGTISLGVSWEWLQRVASACAAGPTPGGPSLAFACSPLCESTGLMAGRALGGAALCGSGSPLSLSQPSCPFQ
jgi:hypothetical protein